jgi:hypothetical protein
LKISSGSSSSANAGLTVAVVINTAEMLAAKRDLNKVMGNSVKWRAGNATSVWL